jgi:hypothetical protein
VVYGENAGAIRTELSTLLRQHRIQQRIGGPGTHTVPESTTLEERAEMSRLIQRYRHGILTWCRQAVTAGDPGRHLDGPDRASTPDAALRRRLQRTLDASPSALPSLEDLTTAHRFPLVDAWRRAARAAALGEHDLAGDVAPGRLDISQRLTLVKDAAETIRALLVLDHRYHGIPGWQVLRSPVMLHRAAEACAFILATDYSVDRLGWRPPARTIDGAPRPGTAGVLQAEHNLLVELNRFPTALNLKRVLDSQRELSHQLSARTASAAPEFSARSAKRAATYAALQSEARNLGGHVGAGGVAAAEGANAISRLRKVSTRTHLSHRLLRDFDTLVDRVDERLAEILEHGARERLYFVKAKVPRIVNDGQVTHRVRERFVPITSPVQTDLLRLARYQLRPSLKPPEPAPGARESRLELSEAITHIPPSRPNAPGL